MWKRADDGERRAAGRALWRVNLAGLAVLVLLAIAVAWLLRHPEIAPGIGYARASALAYR
jgi:hypothetical protein